MRMFYQFIQSFFQLHIIQKHDKFSCLQYCIIISFIIHIFLFQGHILYTKKPLDRIIFAIICYSMRNDNSTDFIITKTTSFNTKTACLDITLTLFL